MKTGDTEFTKIGPLDYKREKVDEVDRTPQTHLPVKRYTRRPRRVDIAPDALAVLDTKCVHAKLSLAQVEAIRAELIATRDGLTPWRSFKEIASDYGVVAQTVNAISLGEIYAHTRAPNREKSRYVALNESGTQRIGEDHPRAKLSDAQVEAMRDEYENGLSGEGPRIGYRLLAKKYEVSKRTVRNIVHYEKRNQWADRWKKVKG